MDKHFKYLVEKYLDNSLSEKEKVRFKKYLQDPACRKYLEDAEKIEKIIDTGLKKILLDKFKNENFDKEEDEIPEEIKADVLKYGGKDDPVARAAVKRMHQKMLKRRNIRRLRDIISVILLVVSVYYLWTDYLKPLPQSLYRAWYKPYEFADTSIATIPDVRTRSAISMYQSGDYAGSARVCNEIIASGTEEGDIHFLYGLNLMALDSMQRAIQEFDARISSDSGKYKDKHLPVYWYKGLCYLKMGKPVSTLLVLTKGLYVKITDKISPIRREK